MKKRQPTVIAPPEVPLVPAWVFPRIPTSDRVEAAFMAGAALDTLDRVVRKDHEWAGAWRQRLALGCGVAAVRLAGRGEDEAALRDAWVLRSAGDDPGPAGNILFAWKRLGARHQPVTAANLREIVSLFGLAWSDSLEEVPDRFDELAQLQTPAPLAAARIMAWLYTIRPDAVLPGLWLADVMLAARMRWPVAVPLLVSQRHGPAFREPGGRRVIRPDEDSFQAAVCIAFAQASAEACRLAADISRRAARLADVSPQLRSKGAREVLDVLLSDDAISGSFQTPKLSRWASRRLFERLLELDAVRELSGRPTFRVFGL